jgi:hypothetical protein
MDNYQNPLSLRNIIAGVIITVIGGIILAYIIQDARFAPPSVTTQTNALTVESPNTNSTNPTKVILSNTQTPIPNVPADMPSNVPPIMPSETSAPVSNEIAFFGQSKNINGLVVSISPPDYDSGCSGTLDFQITLTNQTSNPIVLGFGLSDIKLLGDGETNLSLYGDKGAISPRCYSGFNIETIPPNSTTKFSLRTTDSLGSYNYLELVFNEKTGRLAGEKWRLYLNENYDSTKTLFGQTVNLDGLEITVGQENYFPGCNGTVGFQITLKNTTRQPIILGINSSSFSLYGDNDSVMDTYSQLGAPTTDCYGGFNLETLQAGETKLIAVRSTSSLSGLSYIDLVFESDNRLDGLRWRLILPR